MNVIVAADSVVKAVANGHGAASSSKSKGGKKKGFKRDGKQVVIGVNKAGNKAAKAKYKGNCFHCGEAGHWLRNCPMYFGFQTPR